MRNAWEYKVEFSDRGKLLKKEIAIGPIVIRAIVVITALYSGAKFLPAGFWTFFTH